MSHPILIVFNPILCYVSPKIVIFQELLIIETRNKCHWIWHDLNPKYAPVKQFWCIFPSQNQQNVKFLPEIVIFQELLIAETLKTCGIGFGMPWNLNTCHSSHLDAFFPVKINKKWNFGCFLNSPWQKMKNKFNLNREKVFQKACKSAHVGFWVCQLQCTMLELCVTSTFWVIMVFLHFTGRSRYRVLKHGVGVKWDPRRTAAYVPSHFNSF